MFNIIMAISGLSFKEIIWDQGWIWIIMLVMAVGWIFDTLRQIVRDAKGQRKEQDDEGPKGLKPSYEIIVRRRIE
jgi:hypothetical protein